MLSFKSLLPESPLKYRPDIDGLRAIAVLGVLFYHAELGFPGGYTGVDVFLVISGFLITRILMASISTSSFSFKKFWIRRVRRLLPALAATLVATAIASYIFLLPDHLYDFGGSIISQPLLLSNVFFWRSVKGGYFGDPPEIRPLLHTWSLGLEEQFYLFFPLLLAWAWKCRPNQAFVARGVCVVAIVSLVLSIVLTPVKVVFSFFCLPTRVWELLLGSILALAPKLRWGARIRESLGLTGAFMVLSSFFVFDEFTPFPGYAAILPCMGSVFILMAGDDEQSPSLCSRALSLPAFVWFGQISYSLYLWHWPLVAFASYTGFMATVKSKVVIVLASVAMGYLSYRFVERPFRFNPKLQSSRLLAVLVGLYFLSSMVCGAILIWGKGFPERWTGTPVFDDDRKFIYECDTLKSHPMPKILGDANRDRTTFMIWGDSHAMSLSSLLDFLGRRYGVKGMQFTNTSIKPLLFAERERAEDEGDPLVSRQIRLGDVLFAAAEKEKPRVLFIHALWSNRYSKNFKLEVQSTVKALEVLGIKVVFILDVPSQPGNSRWVQACVRRWDLMEPLPTTEAKHRALNNAVEPILRSAGAKVIDPAEIILSWKSLVSSDRLLYVDSDHISDYGATKLQPLFEPMFIEWNKDGKQTDGANR